MTSGPTDDAAGEPTGPPETSGSVLSRWLTRGVLATIGAYCLLSLSAPLTKWLMVHGRDLGLMGGDAISFCNLFFVGNAAAAIAIATTVPPSELWAGWRQLRPSGLLSTIGTALLAIAVPAGFFFALERTMVANVILISRAGPIFYAVLGSLVLGKRITTRQIVGYGFIGAAIVMTMLLTSHGRFMTGDWLAIGSAFGAALLSIVARPGLEQCGNRPFLVARNLLSAVGFAVIAVHYFGWSHFADLTLPKLIVGVSVYGIVVVGLAQLLWNDALLNASPAVVGGFSFISPLMAILVTALLLHEPPMAVQWWALGIVAVGLLIASWRRIEPPTPPADASMAAAS